MVERRVFSTRLVLGRLAIVWMTALGRRRGAEPYLPGRVLFGGAGCWILWQPARCAYVKEVW